MIKILVAEDELPIRTLYADFLSLDYKPDDLKLVATGDEAISALEEMLSRNEKPRLVITDNKMPGLKMGLDVVAYAAANSIPVIMIASGDTEMTAEQLKSTALQKGASAFLEKPLDGMQTFIEAVRKYAATS